VYILIVKLDAHIYKRHNRFHQ